MSDLNKPPTLFTPPEVTNVFWLTCQFTFHGPVGPSMANQCSLRRQQPHRILTVGCVLVPLEFIYMCFSLYPGIPYLFFMFSYYIYCTMYANVFFVLLANMYCYLEGMRTWCCLVCIATRLHHNDLCTLSYNKMYIVIIAHP